MVQGPTTRRNFLRGAAGVGTAGLIPAIGWAAGGPDYLAAATLPDGSHCLVGITAAGDACFRLPLPGRGHAVATRPERSEAVAFARRPGSFALVLDTTDGHEIGRLALPADRRLNGHGAFTADGSLLFTTETARDGDGRLGIWDAMSGYRRVADIPSGGAEPHEIRLMADGERFAVAIARTPGSGLAILDAASGEVLNLLTLPDRLSIRHVATGQDGTLAAALHGRSAAQDAPPLLAVHRPGAAGLALLAADLPLPTGAPPAASRSATTAGTPRSPSPNPGCCWSSTSPPAAPPRWSPPSAPPASRRSASASPARPARGIS